MNENILNRFISGTVFTGIGRLFIVGIGLIGFILTARWLTTEELGIFTLLQVVVGFIINFSDFGINTAITKFIASSDDVNEQKKLINTAFFTRVITLITACILALIARQFLFKFLGSSQYTDYIDILFYIPVLVGIEGLMLLLTAIAEGLFEFRIVGATDALSSIISFAGILVFVVLMEKGLAGRVLARILSVGISTIFLLIANRYKFQFIFAWDQLKKMIKFGFPLYINQILTFAFLRADTIIIGMFLGASEIALYEIARKIPDSLEMLYDAFRKVYFPFVSKLFASNDLKRTTRLLNTSTRLIAFFGGLGALGTFLFGKEIISLLFSAKYIPSAPIFSILMVGLIFLIIDYTLGYTLVAIGESNKPPLINIFHTLVNFIGYFTLIPVYGVTGAALSGVLGTAAVNPLNVFLLKRKNVKAAYSAFIPSFIIISVILVINEIIKPQAILIRAAFIFIYFIFCFAFSVITREDLKIARREIQKLTARLTRRHSDV